jgi:hypothetical protein
LGQTTLVLIFPYNKCIHRFLRTSNCIKNDIVGAGFIPARGRM